MIQKYICPEKAAGDDAYEAALAGILDGSPPAPNVVAFPGGRWSNLWST